MRPDIFHRRLQTGIAGLLLLTSLTVAAGPAAGRPADLPQAGIVSVDMTGRSLRIVIATAGLEESRTDPAVATVSVQLDGVPIRAGLPLIHMPSRFAMELDLAEGVVRVGGVSVGRFAPVPPFRENLRFPLQVAVRRGALVVNAETTATILLPTVIVPGYLNELDEPSRPVLAALRRHGYTESGPAQNVFWFAYPSKQITLAEGARALAGYVRDVVLPASYAARINVVGYSLGGLMARWNVAYDVDGWSALVDRLVLVGVPNEGTVMAYLAEHAPSALPLAALGRTSATPVFMPTFPFWRAGPAQPWSVPADAENGLLTALNARAIPAGIRVYLFFGSHNPVHAGGPQTSAGITGVLPEAALAYDDGDGLVLAASAQGLPIRGGEGVPSLINRPVLRVDLGPVYHTRLLEAGADRIAGALLDRFASRVDE